MKGILIVLEGLDGAGTTTQSKRLAEALSGDGRDVHTTCEPSGGPVGRLLREILSGQHAPTDATTLSLLFAADRADHLQREVEPALARGAVVISDRWYHSSLAYQGTGEERAWIRTLNERARTPDVTIFLEVSPEVAAKRRHDDDRDEELFDRLSLQRRVAAGYEAAFAMLAGQEHIEIVAGEAPLDVVTAQVIRVARETCQRLAGPPRLTR